MTQQLLYSILLVGRAIGNEYKHKHDSRGQGESDGLCRETEHSKSLRRSTHVLAQVRTVTYE